MVRLAKVSLVLWCLGWASACDGAVEPAEPSESGGDAGTGSGDGGGAAVSAASGTGGAPDQSSAAGRSSGNGSGASGTSSGDSGGTNGGSAASTVNGGSGGSGDAGEPASAGEGSGVSAGGVSSAGGAESGGAGSGGATTSAPPCDIYADAGVPCVGAYSMVRVLSSRYSGPLYQLRRGGPSPNTNEGGETLDIAFDDAGFGDAAAHDAFCGDETCTVSVLYDQSGKGNHLTSGAQSCYEGAPPQIAQESEASRHALKVAGHDVYALFTQKREGYRNNEAVDTPEGEAEQGVYMVANGTKAGDGCCWSFGTGTRNNCYGPSGSTNALFLGTGYWGTGQPEGPWFMADFDAGVWAGGTESSAWMNPDSPSMHLPYAFGVLKTNPTNYALRMGNVSSGELTTAWNGGLPFGSFAVAGGIILGMSSDVSYSSQGVFFEGAITAGRPSDEVDEAVFRSVQAVGYGR